MDTAQTVGRRDSAATTRRILVVEDDRAVRELLKLHLENAGYGVLATPDAVVAGHWLIKEAQNFDLLLVDAHLPYFSGLEFITTIVADTSLPPLPMVLITGHEELATRAEILDVPCLLKPFTTDALLRLVEKTISASPLISNAGLREDATVALLRQHERRSKARA